MNNRLDKNPQVPGPSIGGHGLPFDADAESRRPRVRQRYVQTQDLLVSAGGQGAVRVPGPLLWL